jgi:hypothetical protein
MRRHRRDGRARAELEKPVKVGIDLGGATQLGRASMRREANREVREKPVERHERHR